MLSDQPGNYEAGVAFFRIATIRDAAILDFMIDPPQCGESSLESALRESYVAKRKEPRHPLRRIE